MHIVDYLQNSKSYDLSVFKLLNVAEERRAKREKERTIENKIFRNISKGNKKSINYTLKVEFKVDFLRRCAIIKDTGSK